MDLAHNFHIHLITAINDDHFLTTSPCQVLDRLSLASAGGSLNVGDLLGTHGLGEERVGLFSQLGVHQSFRTVRELSTVKNPLVATFENHAIILVVRPQVARPLLVFKALDAGLLQVGNDPLPSVGYRDLGIFQLDCLARGHL